MSQAACCKWSSQRVPNTVKVQMERVCPALQAGAQGGYRHFVGGLRVYLWLRTSGGVAQGQQSLRVAKGWSHGQWV